MAGAAYYDFFRKITLQPDGVTLEADSVTDTLTITGGNGVAFNPDANNDSFEIDVNYQLYVPIGTTAIRLQDVNSNTNDITLTAGSNIVIGRNSDSEITITATVGGTSKSISNASTTNPVVITTTSAHGFTEGIPVTITDVVGMTELNGNEYWMDVLTGDTFALYTDANLTIPLDGTLFTPYSTGGVATAEYSTPTSLTQLGDVDLISTPPSNGSVLYYNGTYWGAHDSANWDTAYGWGDHSVAGYITSESDPVYTASSWYTTTNNSSNWDTAYSWGDHSVAGYITSESDPVYTASSWYTTTNNAANWDTAYSWGDHALAGYAADTNVSNWDTAYSWGDHALAGYAADTNVSNWDTAYSWGDHALAGYLTSYTETDTLENVTSRGSSSSSAISITNTTASTSTTTGALVVNGGAGIGGTVYAGGFDGDLKGSVFGDDSTAIVDAINNRIVVAGVELQSDPTYTTKTIQINGSLHVLGDVTDYYTRFDRGLMAEGNQYFYGPTYLTKTWQRTSETTGTSGTQALDWNYSDTWHITPTGSFSIDLQNGYSNQNTSRLFTIYIFQGATAYMPTDIFLNSSSVTSSVQWQNGTMLNGTPNGIDLMQFLVIYKSGLTYVLGSQTVFS